MRDKVTRDALAIGIAVGVFAIPFGVLAVATGATVPFFQEWLRHHTPQADYWRSRVFDDRLQAGGFPHGP